MKLTLGIYEPKVIPAGVHPNCKCVLVPLDIAKVMYDNSSGTANKGSAFEQMTPELKEYEAQCDKEWKESSFALTSNIDNAIAYIKMSKSDIKQLPEGILQKLRLIYDDELAKAEIWAYAYYGGGSSMEVFLNRVSYVLTAGGSDFLAKHLNPYSFKRIELLKSNHRTAAFFGDLAGLSYIFAISGALADTRNAVQDKAEDKGNKYSGESYNGARNPSVDFNNAKGNSTAQSHFDRHGAGFNSVDDYVSGSRNFLEKPPTSTTQSFVSSDGTYFRYDTATNEFGIMNKHGGVSTYFRPETGLNYWLEQISKYAPK